MIRIPIIGGVYLRRAEKVTIAQQLIKGIVAQSQVNALLYDNEQVIKMAGAMERASCIAIDALQAHKDEVPALASALEQMHAELTAVMP